MDYVAVQEARKCGKKKKKGTIRINNERTKEALETGAAIIAAACPFCNTMLTDGVKLNEKEET